MTLFNPAPWLCVSLLEIMWKRIASLDKFWYIPEGNTSLMYELQRKEQVSEAAGQMENPHNACRVVPSCWCTLNNLICPKETLKYFKKNKITVLASIESNCYRYGHVSFIFQNSQQYSTKNLHYQKCWCCF